MYKRRQGIHPAVIIIILAVLCVAAVIGILYMMGYRITKNDDGYTFIGKVLNGQPVSGRIRYPDGKTATLDYYKNKLTFSNGDVYEGDIQGLYEDGYGKIKYFATGDYYEGRLVRGKMMGKGKYVFKNGDVYEGDFVDGKMEGSGTYTWADGSSYVGEFASGLANGQGIFTFASVGGAPAAKYEGGFANGMKHGIGTYYFDNGDVYTGDFVNDKRTGNGTYSWANGERYIGAFIDNQLDTRLKDENNEFIINDDGTYAHGGKAVYTWPNGRSYTGYFENSKIVAIDDIGE